MSFAPITLDAYNPSPMTGAGNHTYLVADGNGSAVLVDAGVGKPDHLEDLSRALTSLRSELRTVIVTHGHADHASGAAAIAAAHPRAEFLKKPWPGQDATYRVDWKPIGEGSRIAVGIADLLVVETPGHSPDHIALWHAASRTILTGDLLVAGSSVMIHTSRGGNLAEYLRSLDRILSLKPAVLLPAHGAIVDTPKRAADLIRGYIDHRLTRERQVLDALASGHATVRAITEYIYHGLAPALMPAARENVQAHLEKLAAERRAVNREGAWTTSSTS
ncbi:MAG TPA: MBL fold metallo-hydrolase [Vicinamibacterales bacterium]|nr:MBL fold metallo-hydrolase [Vicinamibacterales bacterium]